MAIRNDNPCYNKIKALSMIITTIFKIIYVIAKYNVYKLVKYNDNYLYF